MKFTATVSSFSILSVVYGTVELIKFSNVTSINDDKVICKSIFIVLNKVFKGVKLEDKVEFYAILKSKEKPKYTGLNVVKFDRPKEFKIVS